jgi:type I restriction enzyme S subunit
MQRYDTYNDSGVKWLGEIPEHWKMLPGMAVYKENKTKNTDLLENTVLSLSYGKIIVKKDINEGLVPAEYSTYQIVHPGFIIIRCTDLQNDKISLRTGLVENDGIITGAYLGLIVEKDYSPYYIHYFLHSWDITKELYRYGSGLRQSLSWLDLKRLPILIPSRAEQDAIVSYLDTATAKIDSAIAQQQKMIDLLNERKQIIINNAVTKGLNPNAKMKDSGVEWIGEIPEDWDVMRMRYLCSITTGNKDTINRIDDGLYPFYVRSPKVERINTYSYDGEAVLMAGDGVGAGKVFHYVNGKFDYHQRVYNFYNIKKIKAKLLYYYMKSHFRYVIEQLSAKSTVDSVRLNMIQDFLVVIPPMQEQFDLIEYLDSQMKNLDDSISMFENQISLLQERKQIIINEVVTGKVKVQ